MRTAWRVTSVLSLALMVACEEEADGNTFTPNSSGVGVTLDPGGDAGASAGVETTGSDPLNPTADPLDPTMPNNTTVDPLDPTSNPDYGQGCGSNLIGVIRDFQSTHPDFERPENAVGLDLGIVSPMLGEDSKPVYLHGATGTPTTTGQAEFDQWFRDTPGVNTSYPISIPLTRDEATGNSVYDNPRFFPADGVATDTEGRPHNYHFTLELHTEFTYKGGEVFTFRGDDDVFTYVNGHLGVDLGGVHLPLTRSIVMDDVAAEFGLEVGGTYTLDFFFAERRTDLSNFRIETSIECFVPIPIE